MLLKEQIMKGIAELPDTASVEDIIEKVIFIDKVERGIEDVKKGDVTADEDLEDEIEQW
jgi:hypothetical protein